MIRDSKLFSYLEEHYKKVLKLDSSALEYVVSRSAAIKAGIVAMDELDRKRVRAVLNYGHTIGHAIEAAAGYSDRYAHGEAVALGMLAAGRIAAGLGLFKGPDERRIRSLIIKVGLPVRIKGLAITKIYAAHLHDKKFTYGKNRFILPAKIGAVRIVDDVPTAAVHSALKSCANN